MKPTFAPRFAIFSYVSLYLCLLYLHAGDPFLDIKIAQIKAINTPPSLLTQNITTLKDRDLSPLLFIEIANNPSYTDTHRYLCLREGLRRGLKPHMRLSDFRDFLQKPKWLEKADIKEIGAFTGSIPVDISPTNTVLLVSLFSKENRGLAKMYLSFSETIDGRAFFDFVQGLSTNHSALVVNQFAVTESGRVIQSSDSSAGEVTKKEKEQKKIKEGH
jgi:hypothetical protein